MAFGGKKTILFIEKLSLVKVVNDMIIKTLFTNSGFLRVVDNQLILDYLDNRYTDSSSRLETILRIKLGIEEKPKCPTCGKPVVWIGKPSLLYTVYCSKKCSASNKNTRLKAINTCQERYGVDNVGQSKEIRKRVIKTNRERYGADYGLQTNAVKQKSIETCRQKYGTNKPSQSVEIRQKISETNKSEETREKYKETCRERYGVDYVWQAEEVKQKSKDTCIKRYGTEYATQSDEIKLKTKETNKAKYGVEYSCQSEGVKQKKWQTYKSHMSFNTSRQEEYLYEYLKLLYPDAIHHYKSEKYPFDCDFYIPSEDLYIEYQGSMFHNGRAFLNNKEDNLELLELQKRAEERQACIGKKTMYHATIDTWADRDVKKREFVKNNINYLEIFKYNSIDDIKHQIEFYLCCKYNLNPFKINNKKLQNCYNYYKNLKFEDKLENNIGIISLIIKHFQGLEFFKKEMEIFANDPIKRRALILNRIKYLNKSEEELTPDEILTGFKKSGIYYGYSHFNPQWTNWFVNKYNIKTIYDPCGGWGHHLFGMLNCNKIVYNDFSKSTVDGILRIKDHFNIDNLEIHYGDAAEYIPPETDGWFMCPPYYNLEHYECGDFESLEQYLLFLNKIFDIWKKSLSRIFGIIIREDLINYIEYKPSEIYELNLKNTHLGKKKQKEKFYIFKK